MAAKHSEPMKDANWCIPMYMTSARSMTFHCVLQVALKVAYFVDLQQLLAVVMTLLGLRLLIRGRTLKIVLTISNCLQGDYKSLFLS